LRINGKKSHNPFSSVGGLLDNHSPATPIDILTVDKYSRLTLTKKLKKIIPLNPEDTIVVYYNAYNKSITLKVQQGEKVVDTWTLTRDKNNDIMAGSEPKSKKQDKEKEEGNKRVHGPGDTEDTLYSTPILLVDDEEDVLMTFKIVLEDEGYSNVKAFSNAKDVLGHLSVHKNPFCYKIAIMDVRMPDINGIQLYQILKILNPSIKIIFITSLDAVNELTSVCHDVKAGDILRKPIEQNQFIRAVNERVSSSSLFVETGCGFFTLALAVSQGLSFM
jgi:CheY-like chemotaxis protein